ncbi:Protein zer-1 -like protein [Halotydeus destructor]|nr:Protein zer-1 -like protein [Halotydeus destructor]
MEHNMTMNEREVARGVGNVPQSLVLSCVKKIVTHQLDLSNVALPQEICNLILEVFRNENVNKLPESGKVCGSFLSQFTSLNSRISHANFSGLPITDKCLTAFVKQHSKYLVHLDISNCTHLSELVLDEVNQILTESDDINKIMCRVTIYDENLNDDLTCTTEREFDSSGMTMKTVSSYSHVAEKPRDLRELYRILGIYDDPFFVELRDDACSGGSLNELSHHEKTYTKTIGTAKRTFQIEIWQNCPLSSLIIGKSTQILPDYLEDITSHDDQIKLINPHLRLRKLVIHEWTSVDDSQYLNLLVSRPMTTTLQYLDLSNCSSIGNGATLLQLRSLTTLILHNIPKLHHTLKNISSLKSLRYLDISASNDRYGHGYKHPDEQLSELVVSLPNLTHLDISGTNLAGQRCEHIKGLESRHGRPFEFLGLYNTANEAAYRQIIPALKIAGDANEEQVLNACELYIDRVEFLRRTLNDLFHCFRFETNFHDVNRALDVVLMSMSRHLGEKQIQIAASASLFYIVKSDEAKHNFNMTVKREIIKKLLDAMHHHLYDTTMLRNGSLTLIHFKIPQDVLFEYHRLVKILLHIVTNDEDDFIQRLGIYLLNSLACQVDGEQKTLVGDLGAITKMLSLIEARIQRDVCDEVMETAWSTMWNVTDETPINCQRFLENRGMELFVNCMTKFSHSAELLRNMMGLLGNVAECQHLRCRLMEPQYIEKFSELLSSESDGIEVSYNAAGILSHIASDGMQAWYQYLSNVDCDSVMQRMRLAISRWKINSKRNINYRSFEPILRLLAPDQVTTEAQYWAVWALANLTRVYSSKYCPLLIDDGGVSILEQLLTKPNLPGHISQLAKVTLLQVQLWKTHESLGGLEESEEINIEPDLVTTC